MFSFGKEESGTPWPLPPGDPSGYAPAGIKTFTYLLYTSMYAVKDGVT